MTVLDELKRLSAAEDFFRYLDVEYEPRVLNVARLHILKRMGQHLQTEDASLGDDELRARCREHLAAAYSVFTERSPIDERLFKVHKDAVREQTRAPARFVALEPLKKI
jgi:nitrogenase-stabilizing/protective protein